MGPLVAAIVASEVTQSATEQRDEVEVEQRTKPIQEAINADQQSTDGLLYTRAATAGVRPESREVDVIASTDVLDSFGTILRQNWQLERFKQNPIVLWGHNSSEVPIGRAPKVGVKGSKKNGQQLEATIKFREAGISQRADEVWAAIEDGTVRGVSVGFLPHSYSWEKQDDRDILILDDNELMEISLVSVPANPDALVALRTRMLAERKEKQVEHRPGLVIDKLEPGEEPKAFQRNNNKPSAPAEGKAAESATATEEKAAPAEGNAAKQLKGKKMDLSTLKSDHPEVYAAAKEEGRQEGREQGVTAERDRVSAHLIRGQASGAMALALESVENGAEMTETLKAKYDTAGKNKRAVDARQEDNASVEQATQGASEPSKNEGMEDRVANITGRLWIRRLLGRQ